MAMATAAWGQSRIATVDLRKVLENYWRTKQAEATIKDRQASMQKDLKDMEEEARKTQEEYQTLVTTASDTMISAEERDRRKRGAEEKLKQLRDTRENMAQYDRQARVSLEEQYKRMRDNLLTEIRNVINTKAKQAGFALVFDASGMSVNNGPAAVVLYTNNENDLTDDIIKQLNATAPVETAAPEEKPDDKKAPKKKDEKK
jgi:outer membrane protein